MNPTNQPVSFYGDNSRNTDSALLATLATKTYDYPGMTAADSCSDIRAEVGELRGVIKDASANMRYENAKSEAEIRADIKDGECATIKAIGDSECRISKEVMENKFAITKEVLETKHSLAKDILRSEYENKLAIQAAIKEINTEVRHSAERTQDKIDHGFEEVNEKLCECCGEAALAAANTQNGLVNIQNLLSQLVGDAALK